MSLVDNSICISYINTHGQSGLTESKQLQIEDFMKQYKVDIGHLQEIEICDTSFSNCNFISSSFNILSNNASNKFGTASLIRSIYSAENIQVDNKGRAIMFDIGEVSFGNFYVQSGTDSQSRSQRESFLSDTMPQLLTFKKQVGCLGGDWNCIAEKADATTNPDSKISTSLKCVIKTFELKDSYRVLHPNKNVFSRYYSDSRCKGASRLDRQYHFGNVIIKSAQYIPLAFSDHHALVIHMSVPEILNKSFCPRGRQLFRLRDEVINDSKFQNDLSEAMLRWKNIKSFGMDSLTWWETIVKPGVKKIGLIRGKEI